MSGTVSIMKVHSLAVVIKYYLKPMDPDVVNEIEDIRMIRFLLLEMKSFRYRRRWGTW